MNYLHLHCGLMVLSEEQQMKLISQRGTPSQFFFSPRQKSNSKPFPPLQISRQTMTPEHGVAKVIDLHAFNTIHRLLRVTAWVLRFLNNLKKKNQYAGPPRGGRQGGGQLALGPKQLGAPNLRNILKLNKAPSRSGRV